MTILKFDNYNIQLLIKRLWKQLSRRRKRQLFLLLFIMIMSGFAEMFSLTITLPFLMVLSNPITLYEASIFKPFINIFGINTPDELQLPVTILFILASIITAGLKLSTLWINRRLAAAIGTDLSCEAYRRTLFQPYEVHLERNSSEMITVNFSQVTLTVNSINSSLQFITSLIGVMFCLSALLITNWKVAFVATFIFSISYLFLSLGSRKKLSNNSDLISSAQKKQMKVLQEGLGAIRDILLDGSQQAYINIYKKADISMRSRQAQSYFLASFPRYFLEAVGLVLIALISFFLINNKEGIEIIPILGTFALGAQRLLLSMQQCYSCWALIKVNIVPFENVLKMLEQSIAIDNLTKIRRPIKFRKSIQLIDIDFEYKSRSRNVLRNINLEIKKGDRVGIVGTTGSGKSTLTDILMGLLRPTNGEILIDGEPLHDPKKSSKVEDWKAVIAHVPQNIFLSDLSFAENIAFGVPRSLIELKRVKKAAQKAKISDFIESTKYGYETFTGERGLRLSGGQRQRIGIARALYKQADILIFDEATSALDSETENEVMNNIKSLHDSLTIILVAHRITTVSNCDWIISLSEGKINKFGKPKSVLLFD